MDKPRTSLSISVRRHFVDEFFFSKVKLIKGKVIDIGGKKAHKRGLFDVSEYSSDVTYVNIEEKDEPDILADAAHIPLPDATFDTALMGELLEHVPNPLLVIKEAHRLLKPGGILIATVPFMVGAHGDPYDYGRYTPSMFEGFAKEAGFKDVEIVSHGKIFSVTALMLQHIFRAKNKSWQPLQNWMVTFLMWLDKRTDSPLLKAWTTGYGIVFKK